MTDRESLQSAIIATVEELLDDHDYDQLQANSREINHFIDADYSNVQIGTEIGRMDGESYNGIMFEKVEINPTEWRFYEQ